MALKKEKTVKGIKTDYWKIYRNDQNIVENKTCVRLALYPSKEVRDLDVMNFLELQAFIFDGVDFTREQLYGKIKESNKVQDTNEDGSPKVDENDEPVMVETNWFIDAEDV
jgi:hypothetical protein